jgi:hypothetical protein
MTGMGKRDGVQQSQPTFFNEIAVCLLPIKIILMCTNQESTLLWCNILF